MIIGGQALVQGREDNMRPSLDVAHLTVVYLSKYRVQRIALVVIASDLKFEMKLLAFNLTGVFMRRTLPSLSLRILPGL